MKPRYFYSLRSTIADRPQLTACGRLTESPWYRCPGCSAFIDEELASYDAVIDHLGRRGLADILPVSSLHFVFRRDLIDLWQAHGVTGFSATPVHVIGWSKRTKKPFPTEVPEYALVRPSAFVRLEEPPPLGPPCPVCGSVAYAFPKLTEPLPHGVQIDESSWDGSSIFGVLRLGFLFCTREVAELTLRAGYSKHFGFTRVEELYTAEPYDRERWADRDYGAYYMGFIKQRVEDL